LALIIVVDTDYANCSDNRLNFQYGWLIAQL